MPVHMAVPTLELGALHFQFSLTTWRALVTKQSCLTVTAMVLAIITVYTQRTLVFRAAVSSSPTMLLCHSQISTNGPGGKNNQITTYPHVFRITQAKSTHTHTHTHTYTHTHTHTHTYIYIYIYIYVHNSSFRPEWSISAFCTFEKNGFESLELW